MTQTGYGQPLGAVCQYAYIVEDIHQAMKDYGAVLNVGPWFLVGPFTPPAGLYRGQPTKMELMLANGFSGHVMIELLQQVNDEPSVYKETIAKRGYGFHHYAITSTNFDADLERYLARGFKVAFSDKLGDFRVVYLDTTAVLPGMLEIMELTPSADAWLTQMHRASVGWDGSDPVRKAPMP